MTTALKFNPQTTFHNLIQLTEFNNLPKGSQLGVSNSKFVLLNANEPFYKKIWLFFCKTILRTIKVDTSSIESLKKRTFIELNTPLFSNFLIHNFHNEGTVDLIVDKPSHLKRIHDLEAEKDVLKRIVAAHIKISETTKSLTEKLTQAQKENATLKQLSCKVPALEKTIAELRQTVVEIQQENTKLKEEQKSLLDTQKMHLDNYKNCMEDIKKLKEQLESLNKNLLDLNSENEELGKGHQVLEESFSKTRAELSQLKSDLDKIDSAVCVKVIEKLCEKSPNTLLAYLKQKTGLGEKTLMEQVFDAASKDKTGAEYMKKWNKNLTKPNWVPGMK